MNLSNLKTKIIALIAIIGAVLILIFQRGLYSKSDPKVDPPKVETNISTNNEEIKVVSTSPNPLEEAVILPNQNIEITFNQPIENRGEFKNLIEPKADYEIKLSDDRKTAKIVPHVPFQLGVTFTLFIKPDTKFDGKTLNREIIYHFKTINYQGV